MAGLKFSTALPIIATGTCPRDPTTVPAPKTFGTVPPHFGTDRPCAPPIKATRSLQICRLHRHQRSGLGQKVREGHRALITLAPRADTDRTRFGFLVAHYQHVRNLLHGEVADLGVHLFVAAVELHPESGIL